MSSQEVRNSGLKATTELFYDWSTVPSAVSKVKSPTSSGTFATSRRSCPSMPSGTRGEVPRPQQELAAVSGDPVTPQKSPPD